MFRCLAILIISVWTLLPPSAHAQSTALQPTLTIREARLTPMEKGNQNPSVTLTGVIVYRNLPDLTFVLQDATDAIWVPSKNVEGSSELMPGDRIIASGHLGVGLYAPTFHPQKIQRLGKGEMPIAKKVSASELLAGINDCHYIEVTGICRAVLRWPHAKSTQAMIHLDSDGNRLRVLTPQGCFDTFSTQVDARLCVHGVCTLGVNESGQVLNAQLRISHASQIEVIEPPPDATNLPLIPLSKLLTFGGIIAPGHRIRTRGVVSAVRRDEWVQLQDGERGARVWTHTSPQQPKIGDDVEVIGFPTPGPFSPQIQDGIFKTIGQGVPIDSINLATADEARSHDGRLVSITARLLEAQTEASPARLLLQENGTIFAAELAAPVPRAQLTLDNGSMLRITGISEVSVGKEWQDIGFPKARGFSIHLRGLQDVQIIQPAPWWTPTRLAAALAAAIAALITVLFFAGALGSKNKRLRETEAALTTARDTLAKRVEVRTDQLQAQLAARREEFADYAAVTTERNRLARDLHDSLEQTLAGAALRMDAATESLANNPTDVPSHLIKAAELLRLSQAQVRRTVWNLRSLALEKKNLCDAIRESVKLLTDDSGLHATLHLPPGDTGLTPEQENELLHIVHEAIANILKHSRATEFTISLVREDKRYQLSVEDNGLGFDLEDVQTQKTGRPHYGLRDMQERAEIIGAKLLVQSPPSGGTRLTVGLG
jgi:signal transduction histidine kinase